MKKASLIFLPVLMIALVVLYAKWEAISPPIAGETGEGKNLPADWMYDQRAYPGNHIDRQVYFDAVRQTKMARAALQDRNSGEWKPAGPVNVGGRITDIALHPTDQSIIYAGTSLGGVFKSTDGGTSWLAVFEDEGANSVGDIALAPSEPNTIYVGTGEANGEFASGAFFGNGIYKSTDGGETWENVGLENSNHIGRIAVDPVNADRAYVAATGVLYGKNADRGLYRTLNGGQSWEKVLFVSDSTAFIDVVVNPLNADIVYTATWERIRAPWGRRYAGPTSCIYRSLDGGDNWAQLTNGLPANSETRGRIGLAIAPSNPNTLYATFTKDQVTNEFDGLYKSTDAGSSWSKVDDGSINSVFSSFGWFFGNVRVAPNDPQKVWILGVSLVKSVDGGIAWSVTTNGMHVDFHALEIHPQNENFMVAGNDGGLYLSNNAGTSWQHVEVLHNSMLYTCEIDNSQPERLYGGFQDNGTNRTMTGNLNDWGQILGGDGFRVVVDPLNNNYIYAEYQFGNLFRSSNGGANMEFIFNGQNMDRNNWNTPYALSPFNTATIFYGAQQMYRSDNRGETWVSISNDLTKGLHPSGTLSFGTISTIGLSESDPQTIYVGTDDGNVQVTFNGGANWNKVTAGLPNRYVTCVAVHPTNNKKAYVTLSGYRDVDYLPHVFFTANGGAAWQDVSGNLPEVPVNDIILDPAFPDEVLYLANDLGVWYSINGGAYWEPLGNNFPMTVVNDLDFHPATRKLVAATFGRSMFSFDAADIGPVAAREEREKGNQLALWPNPVRDVAIIRLEPSNVRLGKMEIFSANGQLVHTITEQGSNQAKVDLAFLPTGVYFIRMQGEGSVFTKKFVKV